MIPREIQQIAALAVVAAAAVGLALRYLAARRRERACSSCALRGGRRDSPNRTPSPPLPGAHQKETS